MEESAIWLHKTNRGRVVYPKKKFNPVSEKDVKRWIRAWLRNRVQKSLKHLFYFSPGEMAQNVIIQVLGLELAKMIEQLVLEAITDYGLSETEKYFVLQRLRDIYNPNDEIMDNLWGVFESILG